ncbi:hypothetical protein M446_6967 (plasmid) [Methylobacterium sp. 4-46]|uniref:hypothetical protein n=1 Tax=unclassified Methylobacterium TaxID=2615210 RepID=UPI000152D3EB|nr:MULTISPECIES: hypothetical protein [Methylobacterium]ACA21200.1 hypothetical protein M446_6967 [Methylobacterium sp. 4-46]WFT83770.1 hypothetical protein QA634_35440 [Methylobacterium nodulans]
MPRKPASNAVAKSAVSNGTSLFLVDEVDRRSAPARRFRDIVGDVTSDLGGRDEVTAVQQQLIRRFATLALTLELQEAAIVEGGQVDLDLYGRLSGQMNRLASTLGLKRVMRDANELDLKAYMARKAGVLS